MLNTDKEKKKVITEIYGKIKQFDTTKKVPLVINKRLHVYSSINEPKVEKKVEKQKAIAILNKITEKSDQDCEYVVPVKNDKND